MKKINSRKRLLHSILKESGYFSNIVKSIIDKKKSGLDEKATEVTEVPYKVIGGISLGPYTSAMVPPNPVKPDGSVDIVISYKAIGVGDTKGAGRMGTNAVIVSCYFPEIGSAEHAKRFGGANFTNKAVGGVLAVLQKGFPDKKVHLGKLSLVWWSGGYGAARQTLAERNRVKYPISNIVAADGLHAGYDRMQNLQPFVDFAAEARKDPSKSMTLITTGVVPGEYASTAETAKYIMEHSGGDLKFGNPSQEYNEKSPYAVGGDGGFNWIQLDKPSEKAGDYTLKQMKRQHALAYRWFRDNAKNMLV